MWQRFNKFIIDILPPVLVGIITALLLFIFGCSYVPGGESPTESTYPLEPQSNFSACDDSFTIDFADIKYKEFHPRFSYLKPRDWGDNLTPADHSIFIDDNDAVHCIWIRGGNWMAGEGVDFGHASSTDMIIWTPYDNISLQSTTHQIDRIWAPHVIRENGVWNMYFTGVELREPDDPVDGPIQRIFLTTSSDLVTWSDSRMILEPIHELTAWGSTMAWGDDGRDPMVFMHEGTMKMILTVRLTNGLQTLAIAERIDNEWSVINVIEEIAGYACESGFLYYRDGIYYLSLVNWMRTVEGYGRNQLWTSFNLFGTYTHEKKLRGQAIELVDMDNDYIMSSRFWWNSSIIFTQLTLPEYTSTNMIYPGCYTSPDDLFTPTQFEVMP